MDPTAASDPSILTEPMLVIRQVWATSSQVEYHVFDQRQSPVATAHYLPEQEVAALLGTYRLRARGAAALRVVDQEDRAHLTVAFPGMRARTVMLIQGREGQHLGEAVKTDGYRKVRYELRHLDAVVGAVQVLDWRARAVRIEDGEGAEVAMVRTIDDGCSFEALRPLVEPLRSLVIASTVALQAAIGDETRPGAGVEHGGGTTLVRLPLLPPIFDRLRRKRR